MEIEIDKIKIYEDYKKTKDSLNYSIESRQMYYEHISHLIGWLRYLRKCEKKRFISKVRPNIMFVNHTDMVEKEILRNIVDFRICLKHIKWCKNKLTGFNVL